MHNVPQKAENYVHSSFFEKKKKKKNNNRGLKTELHFRSTGTQAVDSTWLKVFIYFILKTVFSKIISSLQLSTPIFECIELIILTFSTYKITLNEEVMRATNNGCVSLASQGISRL